MPPAAPNEPGAASGALAPPCHEKQVIGFAPARAEDLQVNFFRDRPDFVSVAEPSLTDSVLTEVKNVAHRPAPGLQ